MLIFLRKFGGRLKAVCSLARHMQWRHYRWNWQCLIKKIQNKRVVVFEHQQPRDWAFLAPVFHELGHYKNIHRLVLINDRERFHGGEKCTTGQLRAFLVAQGVPESMIATNLGRFCLFAEFFLAATVWENILPIRRRIIRVALPHGLVNKVNQYGEEMREFDILCSTGPLCTENAEHAIHRDNLDYAIWKVGYPKVDHLFQSREQSNGGTYQITSRQQLHVLFAPSYGKHALLDKFGLEPVDILAKAGYYVIIKLHPMSLADPSNILATGGVDWKAMLQQYKTFKNVTIAGLDSIDWMQCADVMISDVSGIAYEFLLMDKPVVFVDCPEYFTDDSDPNYRGRSTDLSYWGRKSGAIVAQPRELPTAIEDVTRNATMYRDRRRELQQKLLYNPGTAGTVAAELIHQHLV